MSQILKTEAVVLSKLNYSDSSKIAHFYTKDFGKISAIIKGARAKNNKIGAIIDPINLLEIVFYRKETREIQLVSNAELISFFPDTKNDFDKLKFSYAIIELVNMLTHESEVNLRLFNGMKKILESINASKETPDILFMRFFVFILQEAGFELQLNACILCEKKIKGSEINGFNYEKGILCKACSVEHLISTKLNMELFELLVCLKYGKKINVPGNGLIKNGIKFLENFLKHHLSDYKGIQSLKLD